MIIGLLEDYFVDRPFIGKKIIELLFLLKRKILDKTVFSFFLVLFWDLKQRRMGL
jgi:hypothetical protein